MGFERDVKHEQPCPCGSGTIRIVWYEPDHGYPSQNCGFEIGLDCKGCSRIYRVDERRDHPDHTFVLVDLRTASETLIYDHGAAESEAAERLTAFFTEHEESMARELATIQERVRLVRDQHVAALTQDEHLLTQTILAARPDRAFAWQLKQWREAVNQMHERALKRSQT